MCAVSGFSLGATKSRGRLARVDLEILGDIVGREHITSTEAHLKTVQKNWGVIEDCATCADFLRTFSGSAR